MHRLTNERMLAVTVPHDGVPAFAILDQRLQASSINIDWHNYPNPRDVDDDQSVSPLDALRIIDQINKFGSRQIEGVGEMFCDVDNDHSISPLD
ncbi:MAG: dockerin type I domain-containing protein, partial [Planctomycetota bacterium]